MKQGKQVLKDMLSISHYWGSWPVYRNIEGNNRDLYQLLLEKATLESLQSKKDGSLKLDEEREAGFSLLRCGHGFFWGR